MIFFLLLNILLINIEIFSAEREPFLCTTGLVIKKTDEISNLNFFANEQSKINRNEIYGYVSVLGAFASVLIPTRYAILNNPRNRIFFTHLALGCISMLGFCRLSAYFEDQASKERGNFLKMICSLETENLWCALFKIETGALNKKFYDAFTSEEKTKQKEINDRIEFFKKIIHANKFLEKTNQLDLRPEQKTNIDAKITYLLSYHP